MNDSFDSGELGSLAQAARGKQLKSARGILIAIGILTLIANAGLGVVASNSVDRDLENDIVAVESQGMEVDPATVEKVRASTKRAIWTSVALWCLVGVVFIVLGMIVYRYPVPATVIGLVLYLGGMAITAAMDPTTLAKGWIIKILVIAGLFKAVQAAIAMQKQKNAAAGLEPALP